MADTVTMSASHYEELTNKAKGEAKAGLYGEAALSLTKRNKAALMTIAGAGIGWYFLSNAKTWRMAGIKLFDEYWWLKGLLVLAVGWYLWRKQNPYATAVIALGAALFAQSWRVQQNKAAKPEDRWEAGSMSDAGDDTGYAWDAASGQWVRSASGGEVLMPPGGTDRSEEFAQRVFSSARAAA